jgi:two-component system sensor histidine kinase/response regulator
VLVFTIMAAIEEAKHNPAEEVYWLKKEKTLNDSLFSQDQTKQMADFETKYQTAEKEQKITLLNQQHVTQEAELKRSRQALYFTGGGILLVLAFAFFMFFNQARFRKLNQLLTRKNDEITIEKEKTEKLSLLKDKLFSIISHDLRSPLVYSTSLLELIKSGNLEPDKLKRYSSELADELHQTIQLFDNLLNWAASQLKGMDMNREKISIKELVNDNIQMIKGALGKKNILITLDPILDGYIMADKNMANLILRNLLSNAVKFTPEGGKISVNAVEQESMIKFTITDTGTGIEEDLKNELFSGEINQSKKGTNQEQGFGIGLRLCHEFVIKNGGEIKVESKPGAGSSFIFTLPVAS